MSYSPVEVGIDRAAHRAKITLKGPDTEPPLDIGAVYAFGSDSYLLRLARELDDAILHIRLNERDVGLAVLKTQGDPVAVLAE